ncbi:MAG TPA: hypothetical protein VHI50_12195 [Micromonosporaceae bacterium]|jgi:hypothetical protein|nr:hypothetical protein [Micromonosporaceae bacterium]
MSEPTRPDPKPVERSAADGQDSRINRRRDRIVAEIQRNRRGQYRIPTWVLTVALVALVAGWVLLVVLS